jgi:hypothetical protein
MSDATIYPRVDLDILDINYKYWTSYQKFDYAKFLIIHLNEIFKLILYVMV